MKQQASISLKIVDNPIDSKALDNSLLLRATSNGLKLFNNVGEEVQIGNGSSDIQHIFKVTEFPTSGMLDNSIYILESGEVKAYFAEGWIDISQEVVEIIDDSATNNNIPTTKAVKDYINTQLESSIDLSNYYNKTESDEKFALKDDVNSKLALSVVEDFPTSGINNTLYVNNENHAQIYANDQWKDIAIEVVENFDTSNQTTVPTTQAVKDYVDTIQVGPSMKTEATTNAITFKKDISIYKIEVANATTFTFDWSQLDSEICYTFELWVSMSTPVALTFPSDVAWLNDEVPDMSEASTYCIVIRKMPAAMATSTITSPKALLNLAYQYPLVLG